MSMQHMEDSSYTPIILATVQGVIGDDALEDAVMVATRSGGEVLSMDPFSTMQRAQLNYETLWAMEAPKLLVDKAEHRAAEKMAQWEKLVGADIVDAVQHTRKMVVLIDSIGGLGSVSEMLKRLMHKVRSQGGSVDCYVGNFAESAAANLLDGADRIVVDNRSRLMWHLSNVARGTDDVAVKMRKDEISEIQRFFEERVQKEQEEVRRMLHEALLKQPYQDIRFSGQRLGDLGIAHRVTIDTFHTVNDCLEILRMHNAPSSFIDAADKFFEWNMYEQLIFRATRVAVNIGLRPPSTLTYALACDVNDVDCKSVAAEAMIREVASRNKRVHTVKKV